MSDDVNQQPPAGTEPTPAADPPAPGTGEAAATLAELQRQRDDYYDLLLRKAAEFDNYRKRVERERREQAAFEVTELLASLLPVLDDLERALKTDAGDRTGAFRDGIRLIHRQLVDLLERNGVTAIESLGADFDPQVHQAVLTEESPAHRDGEVIEEFRRGYRIGGRLLRPAMVKVAKA